VEIPEAWKNHQDKKCEGFETDENGEPICLDYWWQVFKDKKLDELED
jgi:hypothetical protein